MNKLKFVFKSRFAQKRFPIAYRSPRSPLDIVAERRLTMNTKQSGFEPFAFQYIIVMYRPHHHGV